MKQDRLNFNFLSNNLFTSYALEVDFPALYGFEAKAEQAKEAFYKIKSLYDDRKNEQTYGWGLMSFCRKNDFQ